VTVDLNLLMTDKNLKVAFDFFDKENTGALSQNDIKEILGISDPDHPDIENNIISKIIKEIDTNGDGQISFEEFKELMNKVVEK